MSGAMNMRRPLLVLLLCVAAAASADSQTLPRPGEVVDSNGRPIVIPPPRLIGPNGQVIANPQVGPIVGPGMPVPSNLPTPPVAHPSASSGISDDGGITLNFVDADVRDIAKAVLGDFLGLNYSVGANVTGTVTIQTSRPIAKADALPVLEQALQLNGDRKSVV